MIKIDGLSKSFGKNEVLKSIDAVYLKGKIYGIVGDNGVGKTTFFRCIAGLESYSGLITADKQPLKNHLGLLFTEPYFFNMITGKEYIQLLCNARGIREKNIDDRNIFELPLNQYASTYSTGMKKKLALTAILMQQNDYYIFDEPFNGVDIHSNIVLAGIFRKLRELNKVILISSHILSTLSDLCDEIHLFKKAEPYRKIKKSDFQALEEEMKTISIGDKIEKFNLK